MLALFALVSACTVEPVDFAAKRCPCDEGFECDEVHDLCVERVPNLVAWYAFDDRRTDRATDTSGSGHDAACGGECPRPTEGTLGPGVELDGEHYAIEATGDLSIAGPFTAALWVRPSLLTQATLLAKRRTGLVPDAVSFSIEIDGAGRASFLLAGVENEARAYSAIDAIAASEWFHVAGTWDGTTMRFYLDGAEIASDGAAPAFDGGVLLIGGDGSGARLFPFHGALDDVRIYDRALASAEIAALAAR
jgi:hypothetical protein